MKVTLNGSYVLNVPETTPAIQTIEMPTYLATAQPIIEPMDLNQLKDQLMDLGVEILIIGGSVMILVSGILMVVGLRREGWKRCLDVIQGYGVGLIGPSALGVVAAFFIGIAKLLE